MKRILFLVLIAGMGIAPAVRAQDHAEVGAFVDYFRLGQTSTNFVGVGGRATVNIMPHVQLEAEMNYDFNRVFTEGYSNTSGTITTVNSNISALHGLFGPKFQTRGPVRFFVTAKGGFVNFRFNPEAASLSGFTSSVNDLRANNVDAVFYPGGGVEAFFGPIGFRAEVGDEVVFVNGVHNSWRASFGPQFRF
jgi:hypothetical protein